MNDFLLTVSALASRWGAGDLVRLTRQAPLAETTFIFDGFGSIARPLAEALVQFGARHCVLCDPKAYNAHSPASQCEPQEVGQFKTDVGVHRLSSHGAQVRGFRRDLTAVPEGVVSSDALVIAALDNRRADIASNRRAARMGARLIKVNVEPSQATAAVRAYDFRHRTSLCVECQFTERHYATQVHPKSCDAATAQRSTRSPRRLSRTAAAMSFLAVLEILADHDAAQRWFNHEWLYVDNRDNGCDEIRNSQLTPNPHCRWDHSDRRQNVIRLSRGPASVRLLDLLRDSVGTSLRQSDSACVSFCQRVSLRCGCVVCRRRFVRVDWVTDHDSRLGDCRSCGGTLQPLPFWSFHSVPAHHLRSVWDQPLSVWGVEPFAVLEISHGSSVTTYVIGDEAGTLNPSPSGATETIGGVR